MTATVDPNTDDVAGLVALDNVLMLIEYGLSPVHAERISKQWTEKCALLESQAKALREAEAEASDWRELYTVEDADRIAAEARATNAEADSLRLHRDKMEWYERALAAEARLKEAEKVIEPFAKVIEIFEATTSHDYRDQDATEIKLGHLRAARAFLNAGESNAQR